jgi:hypothetical protein
VAPEDYQHTIGRAFAGRAQHVTAVAHGWELGLVNSAKFIAQAKMAGNWLEVTSPLADESERTPSRVWSLLQLNASFQTLSRIALAPGASTAHLRAELCLDSYPRCDEISLGPRVDALLESFAHGRHLYDEWSLRGQYSPLKMADTDRTPSPDLLRLCSEIGWASTERAGGLWSVTIGEGSSVCEAAVEVVDAGCVCFAARLLDASGLSESSRCAIGILLLGVSAVVRSVKGVAWGDGKSDYAGVASVCGEVTSGIAIDRSLSSLTVACGMVGREVLALRDESLAREYLARCTSVCDRPPELDSARDNTLESVAAKL